MADSYSMNAVNNDPWYRYKNIIGIPSRKRIVCGIFCIFVIFTLLVIAFVVINCCSNSRKLKTYASFQSAINESVDPCNDFYSYSCGLWAERNPIPKDKKKVTSFSLLQDAVNERKRILFENAHVSPDLPNVVNKAIQFFNICVEQDETNNDVFNLLLEYLNPIGGWPILMNNTWNADLFDWFNASAYLIKQLGIQTIIGLHSMDFDSYNSENAMYLKQPDFDFSHSLNVSTIFIDAFFYRLNDTHFPNKYITNMQLIENRWITQFYNLNYPSNPVFISIEKLIEEIPGVNWLKYLQLITNDTLLEINETLTLNDTVIVDNIDYLRKVATVMQSNIFSKIDLANLFGWFVVKDIIMLIPGIFQYYQNIFSYTPDEVKFALKNQCYDMIAEYFSCSLDYLFIKNTSHLGIKENKILTRSIKSTLYDMIKESNRLEEKAKEIIIEKLNLEFDIIGFPNYMFNSSEIDRMYKKFPSVSQNILKYYFQVVQYYSYLRNLYVKIPVDRYRMILPRPITHVSAYYMAHKDVFVLPISLNSPPFLYLHGPSYLNFGAIGSVIGHELMHGFHQWELSIANNSHKSSIIYKERINCFRNQYNKFDSAGNLENNGSSTLKENIADSEGLHIAYKAYKKYKDNFGNDKEYDSFKNLSPDKMFFISFANVYCSNINRKLVKIYSNTHSFPKIRVNEAVSNLEEFATIFNCPKGSVMNPLTKCSIW